MPKKRTIITLIIFILVLVGVYIVFFNNDSEVNNNKTDNNGSVEAEESSLELGGVSFSTSKLKGKHFFHCELIEKGDDFLKVSPQDVDDTIKIDLNEDVIYKKVETPSKEEKDITKETLSKGNRLGIFLIDKKEGYKVAAVKWFPYPEEQ